MTAVSPWVFMESFAFGWKPIMTRSNPVPYKRVAAGDKRRPIVSTILIEYYQATI
jgi:hypothetical protein